jgi:hypothetical protein
MVRDTLECSQPPMSVPSNSQRGSEPTPRSVARPNGGLGELFHLLGHTKKWWPTPFIYEPF